MVKKKVASRKAVSILVIAQAEIAGSHSASITKIPLYSTAQCVKERRHSGIVTTSLRSQRAMVLIMSEVEAFRIAIWPTNELNVYSA